ncbi:hypothetical protein [Marinobacterium litorale]|uniref:hypothetical protein n=1 Tax=Marinobacterium litorale TaxID=404770 RepID=UPI0004182065|nr:hypothetical protein [Marinobacterium litorale]
MSKPQIALTIDAWVECPVCNTGINLLDVDDTSGVDHNDDGALIKQLCPTDGKCWAEAHGAVRVADIQCGNCGHVFDCEGVDW